MGDQNAERRTGVKEPIIQMDNATVDFGNGAGVFDVSFQVAPGTILGLIGPSGCGKTTLVRLLTGMYRPSRGSVSVFGKNPVHFSTNDKERIGYIPQQLILYPNLSVEENLTYLGGMSFFFSGFFLPLSSFGQWAKPISYLIPMTFGLSGLQSLMLVGQSPNANVWLGLSLIILVTYGVLIVLLWRVFKSGNR